SAFLEAGMLLLAQHAYEGHQRDEQEGEGEKAKEDPPAPRPDLLAQALGDELLQYPPFPAFVGHLNPRCSGSCRRARPLPWSPSRPVSGPSDLPSSIGWYSAPCAAQT